MANEGYRVLGVGVAEFSGTDYPKTQQEFKFGFKGLVAFYDPPKANIQSVFEGFYKAGVAVKIITGDNAATTMAIAKQVHFEGYDKAISGDELSINVVLDPRYEGIEPDRFNGLRDGDAHAHAWVERRLGAWVQDGGEDFSCKRAVQPWLAQRKIDPMGYSDQGSFFM